MTPGRITGHAAVLIASLLAAVTQALPQQSPPARTWILMDDHVVAIDGTDVPDAKVYRSQGVPSLLLIAPGLRQPVVIDPRSRSMHPVTGPVMPGPNDKQLEMKDSAIAGEGPPFTISENGVSGEFEGRKIRLTNRPAIVGRTTIEALLAYSYIYQEGMDRYAPSEKDVSFLKSFSDPVRVEVFLGTWCPHCKELVPKFFKCIKMADNPGIALSLTGVPDRNLSAYGPAKEKNVQGVPTFIVYAGTREIGRFSGVPGDSSIEAELVRILAAWRAVSGQ